MKPVSSIGPVLIGWLCLWVAQAGASDQKLPVIDGQKAVATVNEEPVTLEELNQAVASAHAERRAASKTGRIDFTNIVNRLITTRLIVLEARNMGLDELPAVKNQVNAYAQQLLMEMLLERQVSDIGVDKDEVAEKYESLVREWKIKSVRLKKKADALKVESQLAAGQDFDKVAQKVIEWGIGEADPEGIYIQNKELAKPVAQMVTQMRMGSISPMLSIGRKGFIIFRLEDTRLPAEENPQARVAARRQALDEKRVRAAKAYYQNVKERHIRFLDQQLLDALDYEAPTPGFDSLLKDQRILVKIRGEKPITVAELTQAMDQKFYHGVSRAIESKRINSKKQQVLEDMLQKRVLRKEALKQRIDRSAEYQRRLDAHEISVLFGTFIDRVVAPNIKLDHEALESYYRHHSEDFTAPQMIRIKSLVFRKRADAVDAVKKLKKGTDFNWLGANADGQVDKAEPGVLNFEGKLLTQRGLPEDVQKALSNAKPGNFKLYQSPQGHFYVLAIHQIVPPEPQPFEAVRKDIAAAVFNQKVKATIEQWAEQLKEYYPVKIYKTDLNE